MEKPYCKNCYHDPHGSTDLDACFKQAYRTSSDLGICRCKKYVKWSRADSQREEAKEIEEHESALAKEYGIENHPKRAKLWSLAWEHGHSSGFSEIEIYYREFVELIV